jgi:hypothetical protein
MKKILVALLLVFPALAAASAPADNTFSALSVNRLGVYGGMGIHLVSASSIVKYVNTLAGPADRADDWGTAIEFFGGIELPVSPSWGVKLEHSYLFKSYSVAVGGYSDQLQYNVQAPMLMAQYVVPGKGYFLKFSGGGGYHWGTVTPPKSIYVVSTIFRAQGVGLRVEAEGQTAFDAHLYGYISGTLGAEFMGKAKADDGRILTNGSVTASINYVSVGLRFGLMYYF